ncbi:Der GTPase-activating protein YihI [Colwelliaceae bacterium MEBiC 14330]
MSRTKKSRKPGGVPTAKPKLSKQELANVEKRIRKPTGKQAGNRQKEATQEKAKGNQQGINKDPRLGSKKPIALGKIVTKADKPKQARVQKNTIAGVRFIENTETELSAEQALIAIEQDETLQGIFAKQEDDISLTEQEVDYYNDMMERHQALSAQLGIDEDDEVEIERNISHSEDDLWDKLDDHDFSDFEEKE